MGIRQLLSICIGTFFVGMLAGMGVVLFAKLKNLSIKRKHEFHEPASLKRGMFQVTDEIMDIPVQDTVDGHTALQEFKQHE